MLAAQRKRLDPWIPSRCGCVASPAQLRPGILETAGRLRTRRSDARTEMAGKVQRARTRQLAGTAIWTGTDAPLPCQRWTDLPGNLGIGSFSVDLRSPGKRSGTNLPNTGMVHGL